MTAAIGANGRLNSSFAGTDSWGRGCSRAARTASPYQALALTRPVTAVTTRAPPAGRCVITAAATVAARSCRAATAPRGPGAAAATRP